MTFLARIAAALTTRSIDSRDFDGAQPRCNVIVSAKAPDTHGVNTYYGSWLSRAVRDITIDVSATSSWADPYGGRD